MHTVYDWLWHVAEIRMAVAVAVLQAGARDVLEVIGHGYALLACRNPALGGSDQRASDRKKASVADGSVRRV